MSEKDFSEGEGFTVEIERSEEGTKIRVVGVKLDRSKEEFDHAYMLAAHLSRRARELDSEVEEQSKAHLAKNRVKHLWHQEGGTWKLDSLVADSTYRIALSLLRRHPSCTTQAEVVRDTGVPQKTVSNHLGGRKKSVRQYFSDCDDGHKLSMDGLQWVIDQVLPAVLNKQVTKHTGSE